MSFAKCLYNLLLTPLVLLFEIIYSYAYLIIKNYGFAIIALSLAINLLVLPLYRRADAIQEEQKETEARLQKWVNHIKKTFHGDERTMMLQTYYRQNHYKPVYALRGAVSLLLQIPFFIAAYQFLSTLDELNGVSFGPISDLGAPDNLIQIGGISICLLPILMTAINVISTAIFTKGYPLKTKIQLYSMAAFFLVFLYNSPSGLVFYWTLNNVFSLGKTIVYKLKNPLRVVSSLAAVSGFGLIGLGVHNYRTTQSLKWLLVLGLLGVLCCIPFICSYTKKKGLSYSPPSNAVPDKKLYISGVLILTLLVGGLIPSAVVAASPLEFINISYFIHPIWLIIMAFATAAGTFGLWFGVFYWLAKPNWRAVFDKILCILAFTATVNYLFFGTRYGNMSSDFIYDNFASESIVVRLLNLVVIGIVAAIVLLLASKRKNALRSVMLVGVLSLCCMVGLNCFSIVRAVSAVDFSALSSSNIHFSLSQKGKNVVVIMLDRALGEDIPFIFNERPELQNQFSGFTYYSNTMSYGVSTNFGTPGLYGGYEYTPIEINKRDSELLVDKQNEALKVMPVIFSDAGYNVTVFDPTYAGYALIPDLSIYDDYPQINTAVTMGNFPSAEYQSMIQDLNLNFQNRRAFCYSLLRVFPVFFHGSIYNHGNYHAMSHTDSIAGYVSFINSFEVLKAMSDITVITDNSSNNFLMMSNDITHEPVILQEPEYELKLDVDNTEYDAAHTDRFSIGDQSIIVNSSLQMSHYHANMAAMIQLGKWFDFLRQHDVYDNTRIILVSDHGRGLYQIPELVKDGWNLECFYPLLMVKDFNSSDFQTSTEFMTNADVPTIATDALIENPVNPFTGNRITNNAKKQGVQYIIASMDFKTYTNNGTQFLPGDWFSVHDDVKNIDNWELVAKDSVFP